MEDAARGLFSPEMVEVVGLSTCPLHTILELGLDRVITDQRRITTGSQLTNLPSNNK